MGLKSYKGVSPDGLESYYRVWGRPSYRSTTREARKALPLEEEAIIREGAKRVRNVIALEEQWKDTVES